MVWKTISRALGTAAGKYVVGKAKDAYRRRALARKRISFKTRTSPIQRADYNLRKGASMNNIYRVA